MHQLLQVHLPTKTMCMPLHDSTFKSNLVEVVEITSQLRSYKGLLNLDFTKTNDNITVG